jgi:putative hydrolase of the HAD superfamily
MQNPRIKVISFDLDDTLWHVEPVLVQAELAVEQWMRANLPAVADRFSREQLRQLRMELCMLQPELIHQISELRICAMQRAIKTCGYPDRQARDLAEQAFAIFIQHRHQVVLFDGVRETLETLNKQYKLGVITNGNADIFRLEIGELFSFAITAEQLKISKPAPDPFLAMLKLTEAEAMQVIHVGDHHENDIEAANLLGINTIWANLQRQGWQGERPADMEINHFSELPEAIARIEALGS